MNYNVLLIVVVLLVAGLLFSLYYFLKNFSRLDKAYKQKFFGNKTTLIAAPEFKTILADIKGLPLEYKLLMLKNILGYEAFVTLHIANNDEVYIISCSLPAVSQQQNE